MSDKSPPQTAIAPAPWFVYLVRAANGALYCGISDDPHKRFAKHQSGKGARFFHSSPAVALVYIEQCSTKGDALRRERAIKALKKTAKEVLVHDWQSGTMADTRECVVRRHKESDVQLQ
ncbi:GIY-YIG nuclease family protein [Ectopseudomonas mendocina]|uniref:GIY-YIG nuclease family protein n=1 Tax=Ectopseudomonas mendocina TaxID=300 RepID=A0ABZ2RDI9_ECTME